MNSKMDIISSIDTNFGRRAEEKCIQVGWSVSICWVTTSEYLINTAKWISIWKRVEQRFAINQFKNLKVMKVTKWF